MKINGVKVKYRTARFALTLEDDLYIVWQRVGLTYVKIGAFFKSSYDEVTDMIDEMEDEYERTAGFDLEGETLCFVERSEN